MGMGTLPIAANEVRNVDPAGRVRSRTAEFILNAGISAYWLLVTIGVVTLTVTSALAFSSSEPGLYRVFSFVLVGLVPAIIMFLLAKLVRFVLAKASDLFDPTETGILFLATTTIRSIKSCSLKLRLFWLLMVSRYGHSLGAIARRLGRLAITMVEALTAPIRLLARLLLRHAATQ
jgi:hypothetical protein